MGGDSREGDFSGAREATDEERAFHAQQSNGNRDDSYAPRPSEPARESAPPAEPREPREQRTEAAQAPLDLPPPPPTKSFVVWSSSGSSTDRRDE
jgi:hypothetical protein